MLHDQLAAGVRGRQRHDQRADHRVVLLRVLMREEELARAVYEHGVEFSRKPAAERQAELIADLIKHTLEGGGPPGAGDSDEIRGDLPGVTDAGVGERLLTDAETGGAGDVAELPGLRCADGEADLAGAFDRQMQRVRRD